MSYPNFNSVQAQRKLETLRRMARTLARKERDLDVRMVITLLNVREATAYAYLRHLRGPTPPANDPWFSNGKPIRVFVQATAGQMMQRDALVAALFGPGPQRGAA